jgi:hypothetical protein
MAPNPTTEEAAESEVQEDSAWGENASEADESPRSDAPLTENENADEEVAPRTILTRDEKLRAPIAWLTIGVVLALGATQVSNADLGFHLATGRYVLDTGSIPSTNVLSFTEPNHPWLLHEWLSSVFITRIWDVSGPLGLFFAKLAIVGATWSLVHSNARRWGATVPGAGLATILCGWAAATRFVMRPQLFSNLALAGGLWLISRWLQDPESPKARRYLLGTGATLVVAYQWHAGAISLVIALGVIGIAIAAESHFRFFRQTTAVETIKKALAPRLGAVVVAAIGITALSLAIYHPHGPKILLVPFQLGLNDALHDHVIEYRPAWAFPLALMFPFWTVLGLTLASAVSRFRKMPLALVLPPLLFGILALRHQRVVDSFAVVAAPLIAVGISRLMARWNEVEPLVLLTLITTALGAPLQHWSHMPVGPGLNPAIWPTTIFSWIKAEKLRGPTFVSDGWAGPFLAEFFPEQKSFFDPRFEAYSPEHYLGVYRHIRYGQPGWDKLLDDFGIQLILLKYTSPGEAKRQNFQANVRQHLLTHSDWSLIGFDERGEIFARRSGVNGDKAKRYAVSCFDPDLGTFFAPPGTCAKALLAMVDRGFTDNHVLLPTAIAQAYAGRHNIAQRLLDVAQKREPDDSRIDQVNTEIRLIAQAAASSRAAAADSSAPRPAPVTPSSAPSSRPAP